MDKLWSLVPQEAKDKATNNDVPLIDVTRHGYIKVLGKGKLPAQKIKEDGGAVILTA